MKLSKSFCLFALGMPLLTGLAVAADPDENQTTTNLQNSAEALNTRYGLFDGLDHRSFYSQGDFPEPFLVDDSGLEINEARLDWLHTQAEGQHSDTVTAEVEKGFGPLTLEIEIPYERDVAADNTAEGIGNLDLGARCPFYQYVSANDFFDTTFGAAIEIGVPVQSTVSKNAEFVPKIFNDTKIGEHFSVQSIFGYSTLTGPGQDGGLQTFEYGFTFGYWIEHRQLPLPGVQQLVPMFELVGADPLNHDQSGQNSLLGNACFRLNLKAIGRVQPRLGFGFIFPLNENAHAGINNGFVTSLVFEY